ncbi:radical SAM protein [candidate division KSB1 bacterium]|nr:radical SAM protein [candidate division KSB1 bacterium]
MFPGKQLNIKITDLCNAACSFCGYNRNEYQKKIKQGYRPFKLDVPDFISKFEQLKKKGIRKFHITGGEPFMHPQIREFIAAAKSNDFTVNTGTNGSLITEELAAFLSAVKIDYLWLSLDTFPLQAHLEHRGFQHIREKFERGIELLQQYRINFFGQTVISHVIPKKSGLPAIEGHIDYYLDNYGIRRFVFSYPMCRPETDIAAAHLATLGSDSVSFSETELAAIYKKITEIKTRRKDIQIVNPYLSLYNQMQHLQHQPDIFPCFAGRDIFFLGDDQTTLRPCYFYSDRQVDMINDEHLMEDLNYESCRNCQDECFRDPSIIYFVRHYPARFFRNAFKNPHILNYTIRDISDIIKSRGYRET